MDENAVRRAVTRITYEILERNKGADNLFIVGIFSRGAGLAERIAKKISELEKTEVLFTGLDITPYRDDISGNADLKNSLKLDVEGKNVILIDDMVDTAGTITKAADIIKEAGALSVRAIASHGVMSGPASERVQNSQLEEMVFTDSIPYSLRCAKVKQLSIADMFADTIRRVMSNESFSSQYLI